MGAGIGAGAEVDAGALPVLPKPIFGGSPQPDNSNAALASARPAAQGTARDETNKEVEILVD